VAPPLPDRDPAGRTAAAGPARVRRGAKRAIERLDGRETRLSYAASAVALLFGVMIYLLETQAHDHFSKDPDAPFTTLVLGLVCGVLLFVATRMGRRAAVGFVALFAFLIFGTSALFLGVPFLALAIWLLYRSYRIQKEAAAQAKAARAEGTVPPTGRSGRSGSAAAAPPGKGGRRGKGAATPEANKRFTPKRPPPPAPKPSRRERRAAAAD
jgi:hypothetical protein